MVCAIEMTSRPMEWRVDVSYRWPDGKTHRFGVYLTGVQRVEYDNVS